MIEGFEEVTEELTEYELETLLPILLKHLPKKIGPDLAVTSHAIVNGLKARGMKITGARLRKLINYIRRKDMIPCLVASSKGYYIATDNEDMRRFVTSLQQREDAIRAVRIAMERQLLHKTSIEFQFPNE
jgi:hypothetical protein